MNIKTYLLILLFLVLFSNPLFAQTQLEMNQTAQINYKKADKELNKVYALLMKSLDKTEAQLLKTAQKNWIRFRDSHCQFDSHPYEGGSMQPLVYATCLEEITKKRIAELKENIKSRKN
jgi:uncharacterized protein YecT (DUF1311 family)